MSETSDVVTPILNALERAGITATRMQAGKVKVRGGWLRLAPAGWPDIIGYLPDGRMFGIEAKTATGKDREAQLAWAARARANRVLVIKARSPAEAFQLLAPHIRSAA